MPPSDFANADITGIIDKLSTEEAVDLIAGVGLWYTAAIDRLSIPAIKVSDGPNGIRGGRFFMGTPAKCLPCATALAATWDSNLVEKVGLKLLASEAKLKAASLILAPTCNIQRNPLGGRSFESFSEDPHLSGIICSAYIRGVQSGGIGATIKHFVANDKEDERMRYDSVLSSRALREVYLMPFMLAQKHAQPWSIMTAYNRVNGRYASENAHLLLDILRREWQFDGLIMSDWYGTYSVDHAINAGLDLEMPGGLDSKWRTFEKVGRSIAAKKVAVHTVKERAKKVLELVQKCAKEAPEVLDGDHREYTRDTEEDKALMRKIAGESITLLKNQNATLPLQIPSLKRIAVIGGNAKGLVLSGGGSAALKASYCVSPYDGIVNALPKDIQVTYSEGARAFKMLPSLDFDIVTTTGQRGWLGTWHRHEGDDSMVVVEEPVQTRVIDETRIFLDLSGRPSGLTRRWTLRLRGQLVPREKDTIFEFGLTVAGRAKLWVDDKLVIDNWTRQRRGKEFFGCGTLEEKGTVQLVAQRAHNIYVEFCNVRGPTDNKIVIDAVAGVRLGGAEVQDPEELLESAVKFAEDADAVIAVVGLNADWESEGYDRTTLDLPGKTNELIQRVAEVNPKTIVVTQAGSAITMPWADTVPAIVHAWYLGNATGDAIADILFGTVNPSGKLPLTFPGRLEDVPAFEHFNVDDGKLRYAEDIFVGYKHYQHRNINPMFAFGHGLSYTTFLYSGLEVSKPSSRENDIAVTVTFTVRNTGNIAGSEIAQLYISWPSHSALTHPPLTLKGFSNLFLEAGGSRLVELRLDKYAVSSWSESSAKWVVENGNYTISVGPSSQELPLTAMMAVGSGFEWTGL